MKPFLALAGLALSAGLLTACTDDGYGYGRGSFYSSHGAYYGRPYDGYYDGYYGYSYRNDRNYRRDRHHDRWGRDRYDGRHRGWDGRGRHHKD